MGGVSHIVNLTKHTIVSIYAAMYVDKNVLRTWVLQLTRKSGFVSYTFAVGSRYCLTMLYGTLLINLTVNFRFLGWFRGLDKKRSSFIKQTTKLEIGQFNYKCLPV